MGRIGPVFIFEDEKYENFLPLVWLRPVFDLRVGILTIFEKWYKKLGEIEGVFLRSYLSKLVKEMYPEIKVNEGIRPGTKVLLINSRTLPPEDISVFEDVEEETLFVSNKGEVVAFYGYSDEYEGIIDTGKLREKGAKELRIDVEVLNYLWDTIEINGGEIIKDFNMIGNSGIHAPISQKVTLLGNKIFVAEGVRLYPNVVIDAEEGPVYIDKNVTVLPNAFLKGPLYVGEGSIIKVGAKIYEDVSIGPVCKVGGEVEATIIHSYSNKQHDGFLGHSYVGTWVNIGADTNTSDLRNNYGSVKIIFKGERFDTGMQFLGSMIGDHTKSGINTMFNTGTIVGVFSNIFDAGFPPKFIPSFSWGGRQGFVTHELEKAIATARRVMKRRKVELSTNYEEVIRKVFELTQKERDEAGVS